MDRDIGSREMSDDDDADTVSVTSTVLSEQKDNYPLEGILAEREGGDGEPEYLVKWEGYPEERNTWEKREMFQADQTFLEWEAQKMRITRGLIQPFNLDAFDERVEKFYAARDKRKRLRYYKRIRLGLPVTPFEENDEPSEESDHAEEAAAERELTTMRRRRLKRRASMPLASVSTSEDSEAMDTELSSEAAEPPQRQWSSKEQSALMNGLERANGPRYEAILEMHSLTLKDFTVSDLETQARMLKKGWKDSGRAVPQCLQLVPDNILASKAPKTRSEMQSGRNEARRRPSRSIYHDEASDTSADSLMEDLRRKGNAKSAKKQFKKSIPEPPKNAPTTKEKRTEGRKLTGNGPVSVFIDATPSVNKARVQGDIKSTERKAKDLVVTTSKSARSIHPPQVLSPLPSAVAAKPGPTRNAPAPVAQMGPRGRGPRRAPPPSTTYAFGQKRRISGPAVLGNWDPKKPHWNSSLAPKKLTGTNAIRKPWDKHSIRRRAVKKGRTEPAPDMSKLQLINLKDGKAVKDLAKLTTTQTSSTKTAYQLLQERERQATERENPTPVEPTTHDTSWMDQMDDEVVPDAPSVQAPILQAEQPSLTMSTPAPQAPQAPMKNSDEKQAPKRRVSIPLSAYTQRSQALPRTSEPPDKASAASPPNPSTIQLPFLKTNLPLAAQPSQSPQATRPPPSLPKAMMKTTSVTFDQSTPQGPMRSSNNQLSRGGFDDPANKDESDVWAAIETGPERNKIPSVTWRGLEFLAKKALINSVSGGRSVWFAQICTAADYKARFDHNIADIFGNGFIVAWPQQVTAINDLAGLLRLQVAGALFHAMDFTLLAYPVSTEDWAFLDDRLPYIPPSQIQIRFIMRTLIRDVGISRPIPDARKPDLEKKLSKRGTAVLGEPGINTVMRSLYGITYQRLIQQSRPSSESARFFLLFPKETKDEHDLVVQFLDANQSLEIYSYNEERDDGVWQYFCYTVESGVLIAHSSFWHFHHMPGIIYMLRKLINVWALSLRKDKKIGIRRHLTRLFPHGCVLLLTDSLILLRPLEAVRILGWFRLKILVEKPAGTWKIVTRPGLRKFCLNCCNERKDDEEGKRFVQIYQELVYMLDPDDLYDWEEEAPKDEAPIHCMGKIAAFNTKVGRRVDYDRDLDRTAIQKNDEVLTEFFAGWSSCRIEDYRRFQVISGFEDGSVSAAKERWAEKCTFLEFLTPATFYERLKVPDQTQLDELAALKHQALMAEYDRRDRELDARAALDKEEARRQVETRTREWDALCAQRPGLREQYERLQAEMEWSDGEGEAEREMEEERRKEWDEWSRDSESVVPERAEGLQSSSGDELGEEDCDSGSSMSE